MEERPAESCLEQLGTHLAHDGGWFRIQQPGDVIELFSTDAPVSLAVSSAGGRTTQPYDGGPGNLLRTKAAREQLFEDVENWRPRLFVVYLTDWTPEVSELVLELVRRQRADGRDLLLRCPIHTTIRCPLVTLEWDSIWSTELWRVGGSIPLNERHDSGGLRQRGPWLPG